MYPGTPKSSTPNISPSSSNSGSISKEDMVDVLNLEDVSGIEEEKKEEVKEDKEEKSEEEPEIKLVEEHEEEPPPTEGELEVPFRRQEILKKYPNVFKDF